MPTLETQEQVVDGKTTMMKMRVVLSSVHNNEEGDAGESVCGSNIPICSDYILRIDRGIEILQSSVCFCSKIRNLVLRRRLPIMILQNKDTLYVLTLSVKVFRW